MATNKKLVHLYDLECDSTADRLAYVFTGNDIGRTVVRDFENGKSYNVVAAGTGAACMAAHGYYLKSVPIPLHTFLEVSSGSDVGNLAAIGGNLASDSAPILRGRATVNNQEISWATGNVDPIGAEVPVPYDFDGTVDCYLELIVNSGTTDAVDMVIATTWDGGTEVADAAVDTATKSATDHTLLVTIAAADVPDAPKHMSLRLTPPTHGTNAIQLSGVRLLYVAK